MSNFDFLSGKPQFEKLLQTAVTAENLMAFSDDASHSVLAARKALEIAINWIYSVDPSLVSPQETTLFNLTTTHEFRTLAGEKILSYIHTIRQLGNKVAHSSVEPLKRDDGIAILYCLFRILDWIDQVYGKGSRKHFFDERQIPNVHQGSTAAGPTVESASPVPTVETLKELNKTFAAEAVSNKEKGLSSYYPSPCDERTEAITRKIFIDQQLSDAGWHIETGLAVEFPVEGMPSASGKGRVDYVLFDGANPLAVVEAKKTSVDTSVGLKQANLYADCLEKKFGLRPFVFLANGYTIEFEGDGYPRRKVGGFFSREDLQKLHYRKEHRIHLSPVDAESIKPIAGRYYQIEAITRICEHFDANNRKALLVMATGTGKTRTALALIKCLMERQWVRNVLFLADRNCLVNQAQQNAVKLLPDVPITNLCEDKKNLSARFVLSTYQTMMGCIDSERDNAGKQIFTAGHFDLIICDEAHRSIYRKYQEIFNYFDGLLVGLTATPKSEIDKNTYRIFELNDDDPTYCYDYDTAVKDKHLVPFRLIKTSLKFMRKGIKYSELPPAEQEQWEETFIAEADNNGALPEMIPATAVNSWVMNRSTIEKALSALMEHGIKIDYGDTLGKTIIFARSHKHAEAIRDIFEKMYPQLPNEYCQVIDNQVKYNQSIIDKFVDPKSLPQIAVSVDMLDTGIDVPECVNLVFFKLVYSKSKFWQMIGRGTRLCPGLISGHDKAFFLIFDLCQNFEFFEAGKAEKESKIQPSLDERLFLLQAELLKTLQENITMPDAGLRDSICNTLEMQIKNIDCRRFPANQHVSAIDRFQQPNAFRNLDNASLDTLQKEVARFIPPKAKKEDASAKRFDALMTVLEIKLATGSAEETENQLKLVREAAKILLKFTNIPAIKQEESLLNTLARQDGNPCQTMAGCESVRQHLRDLIKYVPLTRRQIFFTDFEDDITVTSVETPALPNPAPEAYRERVEHYIRSHQGEGVIAKIRRNEQLTPADIAEIEHIIWSELGTHDDYVRTYENKNIGLLIRQIVHLDKQAALDCFADYLRQGLNSEQIAFIHMIVDYVTQNGYIEDNSVYMQHPFTDLGIELSELFPDKTMWAEILQKAQSFKTNATI